MKNEENLQTGENVNNEVLDIEEDDDDEEDDEEEDNILVDSNTAEAFTAKREALRRKGFINVYMRREYIKYFVLLDVITSQEMSDIYKIISKQGFKKGKKGIISSIAINKAVKFIVLYKQSHKDFKLLEANDFLQDARTRG